MIRSFSKLRNHTELASVWKMSKRKASTQIHTFDTTPQKRQRRAESKPTSRQTLEERGTQRPLGNSETSQEKSTPAKKPTKISKPLLNAEHEDSEDELGSPTPKPAGKTLLSTQTKKHLLGNHDNPREKNGHLANGIGSEQRADQNNGSSSNLQEEDQMAMDVLESDMASNADISTPVTTPSKRGRPKGSKNKKTILAEDAVQTTDADTPVNTPSKRGRPKGSKNRRSPTPEGDIPPEERYFFQNRAGPVQISHNIFSSIPALTHEEYFQHTRSSKDPHEAEKTYLGKHYTRSFPQWKFELTQGFSVCLYGYGSKRKLVHDFAEWMYTQSASQPSIVIINGFTSKINVRNVLSMISTTLVGEDEQLRMMGQPQEMLDTLLSYLSAHPPQGQLILIVNSIDAPALRRSGVQSIFARLAAHPLVNMIATADTPTFPLMWNSSLLDQYSFTFHDCTTFTSYDAEISVVDDVHDLLGRKGRRIGGKEGIGFVLKSLPENARNLYAVLLTEILSILTGGIGSFDDEGQEGEDTDVVNHSKEMTEDIGVEYRALYQKASDKFICSSDMNFRFLLKEFHDHQMITSRRDAGGTEVLSVPLGKEDVVSVLEDLGTV